MTRLTPLRAIYTGYTTGTENHGDEALQWIIRDLLAPDIEVVTSTDEYEIALLGGGTLINQSPWLIDVFSERLQRATRGIVIGSGVGDTNFWGNHFARWIPLLEQCEAVGVRGSASVKLLQKNGFDRAEDIGDPYLWLQTPITRAPVSGRIGVNIGSTNNALWGTTDAALCEAVGQALRQLESRGHSFSFISVWENDLPLIEQTRSMLDDPQRHPVLNARTQTLEVYSALAQCELFIGEKLHANAMAAVSGIPFIALEYQPKVREFAASLGLDKFVISTADVTPNHLATAVEEMRAENLKIKNQLHQAHAQRRVSIIAFAQKIKQRFAGEMDAS